MPELPPDKRKFWEGILARVLKGEQIRQEFSYTFDNGEIRHYDISFNPISKDGNIIGTSEVNRDITERKRIEDILRENEEFLNAIYHNSEIGMFVVNVDDRGKYTYAGVNKTHEMLFGIKNVDVIGKSPRDLEHAYGKKAVEYIYSIYDECVRTKTPHTSEFLLRMMDGKEEWWLSKLTPLIDKNGMVYRIIGGAFNITEQKLIEQKLRESEKKFRSIIDNLPMGIHMYQLDPDGQLRFIGANPAADEILGVDNTLYLGKTIYEAFPNIHETEIPEKFRKIAEKGGFWKKENIVYEDEKIKGAFENYNFQTSPGKMASLFSDITDRKQAEEALKQSERRLRNVLETMELIAVSLDIRGNISFCNDFLLHLTGWKREEVLGKSWFKTFLPHKIRDEIKQSVFLKDIETGILPAHYQNDIITKNGELRLINWNSTVFRDSQGDVVSVTSIGEDITKRKLAEEALRESEEKLRAILEANPDPVVMYDTEGHPQYLNPAFTEVFGWTIDELKGQRIPFVPHDQKEITAAKIKEIYALGKTARIETQRLTKQGDTIDVIVSAAGIEGPKGKIVALVVNMTDITEKMKIERQLQRSQKMESLGLLAGGVAHDLNNVLSGIVSYPELLLLDLPEDSQLRKPIETMHESGHRAVAIVQDLLTVARGVATTKQPLNLNDLIRDYLNSPEFKKLEHFYSAVTVKTNLDGDLLYISGSHVHIRKVVMNLVSNASEAIEGSGNVTISTMNRYVDRPLRGYNDVNKGEYAILSVSDDGSGISSDYLERIFEPFYSKKVMGRSGTGLGLAVVWNVVQDHKGYIDLKSDENGTTFQLYFPITRGEISDKDVSISIKDLKGDGETILVIDDVESQRDISCKMLDTLGYKTKAVSSGEEAVEYLKENTVDLLLLDMIMDPGINGRETYERVIKIHPKQKAMVVSGFAETDDVKEAQKLGAGQYIKKPLTLEKLGLAVKEELEK
jgi:PAS domain S-box-containing protein